MNKPLVAQVNVQTSYKYYKLHNFLFGGEYASLSDNAKVLYAFLMDKWDRETGNGKNDPFGPGIVVSFEKTATIVGLVSKTISKTVRELTECSLLTVRGKKGRSLELRMSLPTDTTTAGFKKLPKSLFEGKYAKLTSTEKITYATLLDLRGLSERNGWNDDMGVFVRYARKNMALFLSRSVRTVVKAIKNLVSVDLVIEAHEKGISTSNRIYVRHVSCKPDFENGRVSDDVRLEPEPGCDPTSDKESSELQKVRKKTHLTNTGTNKLADNDLFIKPKRKKNEKTAASAGKLDERLSVFVNELQADMRLLSEDQLAPLMKTIKKAVAAVFKDREEPVADVREQIASNDGQIPESCVSSLKNARRTVNELFVKAKMEESKAPHTLDMFADAFAKELYENPEVLECTNGNLKEFGSEFADGFADAVVSDYLNSYRNDKVYYRQAYMRTVAKNIAASYGSDREAAAYDPGPDVVRRGRRHRPLIETDGGHDYDIALINEVFFNDND